MTDLRTGRLRVSIYVLCEVGSIEVYDSARDVETQVHKRHIPPGNQVQYEIDSRRAYSKQNVKRSDINPYQISESRKLHLHELATYLEREVK